MRYFSEIPPRGGPGPLGNNMGGGAPGGPGGDDKGGYTSEEEGSSFESDKKFSNFVLFSGALALGILFMVSNVLHLKKERDSKNMSASKPTN